MSTVDYPKALFNQFASVEARINVKRCKIKEEEKIAVIVSQALMKYEAMLANKERLKVDYGANVTMKDLEDAALQHC